MTTIAANRVEIAADSRCTFGSTGAGQFALPKLTVVRGRVFGMSGNPDTALRGLEWIKAGARINSRPDLTGGEDDDSFNLLELAPDGLYLWTNQLVRVAVLEPHLAIGSGSMVAEYVMRQGACPAAAVAAACTVDPHSGEPVHTIRLSEIAWQLNPSARNSRRKR